MLGALCAVGAYLALVALRRSETTIAVGMAPLGLGLGPSLSAILDLVVVSSAAGETGVTIALNNVIRSIGSVLGPQVAIAIVTAAPALAPGPPPERGFTRAFAAITLIPLRRSQPIFSAPDEVEGS
jgi:hypothetical protein